MRATSRALIASSVLVAGFAAAAQPATPDSYVAVISVDGLGASELFGKPSCLASTSTIRALAASGVQSRGVTGVFPTITYPSHATIVTGVDPARHGVVDNAAPGGVWVKNRSDIAGETLWDAARKAGRRVAIVTWPSTYGAEADWLVPEDLSNHAVATADIRKGSTPGLFDALVAATGAPSLLPFAHHEAGTPLDAMTGRFAAEVVRRHKPHLLLTHFLDYDHRMHAGPHSPEACKALERIDGWIAQLREAYRAAGILERTTFFVISDHGFMEVERLVNVNTLLKGAAWDALFPGVDTVGAFELRIAGGSAAFYRKPGGPDLDARRAARLRAAVEKRHGKALRWITPAAARSMGGFPGVLFALCARPGYSFTLSTSAEVYLDRGDARAMHGYCPEERRMDAVFIASGHGVRRAGTIGRMALTDFAPTIASFVPATLPGATGKDRSGAFLVRKSAAPARGR